MRRAKIGCLLAIAALGWGCGSVPTPSRSEPAPTAKPERDALHAAGRPTPVLGARADQLVRTARSLLETPYRYGGADRKGFDCSGLISFLYAKAGVSLPRTAASQAGAGRWVPPDELASGDLVFFGEVRDKPFHVGLVVSEPGEPLTMIHSSSSRGVIETEVLSSNYWLSRLKFGRRILIE